MLRFDDQPGRPPQEFDFGEFADFPHLFRAFAGAFNRRYDAARRVTRQNRFRGIRQFFVFLREQTHRRAGQPDNRVVAGVCGSLQHRNLAIRTQAHYYGATVNILGELRRSRGTLFTDLLVPRRQFPGVGMQRASPPMRKLDGRSMQALREAARAEVQALWTDFCRGQGLLGEAAERLEREQRAPDLHNLGEFLLFIEREHRGVVPRYTSAVTNALLKSSSGTAARTQLLGTCTRHRKRSSRSSS